MKVDTGDCPSQTGRHGLAVGGWLLQVHLVNSMLYASF